MTRQLKRQEIHLGSSWVTYLFAQTHSSGYQNSHLGDRFDISSTCLDKESDVLGEYLHSCEIVRLIFYPVVTNLLNTRKWLIKNMPSPSKQGKSIT
ncbi:hypothetical protein TNIN_273771 [Trichonephila inaurata madagascariensis]|uniref:Uncharacterized protein n=1 Tax=Trichonephila inaurata madagascariensis TaxID=2747483 RepID=A0A8X6YUJ8_9ARAC|nr:hypothetical protein TNIN_273771 [Trichonephila inaurata madagascariensis]